MEYSTVDELEAEVSRLAAEVEAFAASREVHACLSPWKPSGFVTGIELTDLYAAEPGKGSGSVVMRFLLEKSGVVGLPVYLRPSGPDARRFYERHGFLSDARAHGFMVRYPDLDDAEEECASGRCLRPAG